MNPIPANCPMNDVKTSKKHYALNLKITSFLFCLMLLTYPLGDLGRVVAGERGVALSTVVLAFMALAFTAENLSSSQKIRVRKAVRIPLLFLTMLMIFDILDVTRSVSALKEVIEDVIAVLLVMVVNVFLVCRPKTVFRALQLMGLMLALSGIFSVIQASGVVLWSELEKPLKGVPLVFYRTTGFPMDYGLYGIMNMSLLPLALTSLIGKGGVLYRSRFVAGLTSFLILLGIGISQDRSMWLALGCTLFTLGFGYVLSWRKRHIFLFVLYLTVFAVGLGISARWALDVAPVLYSANVSSIKQRLAQYATAIELIKSHPLTGIGNGRFQEMYTPRPSPSNPNPSPMLHNYFLNEAVSTGVVSGGILMALFIWTTWRFWGYFTTTSNQKDKFMALGFLAGWIGILVELLFYPAASGLKIVWIYIGISSAIYKHSDRELAL